MMTRRQLVALAALTLMWGVNWPIMKLTLRELSPLYLRALTMSVGASWLYFFFRWRGVRLTPRRDEWRTIALLAAPNILGWHLFSILGVQELASGRAAILGFTMPIWTVLLGVIFLRERLTPRLALAVVAVAIAIGLLVSHEFNTLTGRPLGILWMELAAILWAIGTLLMRRMTITLPMEALTVWMMLLSSVCLWLVAGLFEPWPFTGHNLSGYSSAMWMALLYSVTLNYGFSQIIWFGMARQLPAATSAMSVMAVPVIGTLSATWIVGEWPRWQDGVAIVFVTFAIAAVLSPARSPQTTDA